MCNVGNKIKYIITQKPPIFRNCAPSKEASPKPLAQALPRHGASPAGSRRTPRECPISHMDPSEISRQLSTNGFCILEALLSASDIDALRAEAERLRARVDDAELCEDQCVLDVPPEGVPPEHSPARRQQSAYLRWRARVSKARAEGEGTQISKQRAEDESTVARIVFRTLAAAAQAALQGLAPPPTTTSPPTTSPPYLFNEHYASLHFILDENKILFWMGLDGSE